MAYKDDGFIPTSDPIAEGAMRAFTAYDKNPVKLWRVYFNCRADFPFLVAVDNGTIKSQIRVQWISGVSIGRFDGCTDMGKNPSKPNVHDPANVAVIRKGRANEPTWWIEIYAWAEFRDGGVVMHGRGE